MPGSPGPLSAHNFSAFYACWRLLFSVRVFWKPCHRGLQLFRPHSLMHLRRPTLLIALSISLPLAGRSMAEEQFRYPAARHGRGEFRYIDGTPVLVVQGTPREIGEQLGALALKPAARLPESTDEFIASFGWQPVYHLVLKTGNMLAARFPADYLGEVDAAAATSGWSRDLLLFGNTILDLRRIIQCSSMAVEAGRSTNNRPLLGRNLDWPSVAGLHEFTLVVIYRPIGKRAFASITFPGLIGCTSGMNDAGLVIAMLDAYSSRDGSPGFNPLGVPTVLLLRRLLEECATVDEAASLLRANERASMLSIAACDKQRAAVLEVTTKQVVVRDAVHGVCLSTNHFRTADLVTSTQCWRYDRLAASLDANKFSVADIGQRLHAVNQGELTLQTMVFEPTTLRLHLAFGDGPASRFPLQRLDLAELLKPPGDEP